MIDITLGELNNSFLALKSISNFKLSPKNAYHIAKLLRLVTIEVTQFEKQRDDLIRKYGETDGDKIIVKEDWVPKFIQEIEELTKIEVKIDWNPITIEMLENELVSSSDLMNLGFLFQELS